MISVIKGIAQTTLNNESTDKIEIRVKGIGNKVLYPNETMSINNGTKYVAMSLD